MDTKLEEDSFERLKTELLTSVRASDNLWIRTNDPLRVIKALNHGITDLYQSYSKYKIALRVITVSGYTILLPFDKRLSRRELEIEEFKGLLNSYNPQKVILKLEDDIYRWFTERTYMSNIIVLFGFGHLLASNQEVLDLFAQSLSDKTTLSGSIIVISYDEKMPSRLRSYMREIIIPPPNSKELEIVLDSEKEAFNATTPEGRQINILRILEESVGRRTISNLLVGTEIPEAIKIIRKSITEYNLKNGNILEINSSNKNKKQFIEILLKNKIDSLRSSSVLRFYPSLGKEYTFENVGGLNEVKEFVIKRKNSLTPEAKEYGVDPLKGILLVGAPGTGKTLISKAIANTLGLPFITLEYSSLFNKYVGESEKIARNTFLLLERLAPVVVLVDEIEKMLGTTGSTGDSGVSTRLSGMLMTFMQETEAPIIFIGTANEPELLPAPLIRAGRFDKIFVVDLPDTESRKEIFKIHFRLKGVNHLSEEDYSVLATKTPEFSGAEIKQVVKNTLIEAFYEGIEKNKIPRSLIEKMINTVTPLSKKRPDYIEKIRKSMEFFKWK